MLVLNNKPGNIVCSLWAKKKSKQHTTHTTHKTNNELTIVFNSLLLSVIDLYYQQTVSLGTPVSLNSIHRTPFSCHKHSPVHQMILWNAQFSPILVRIGFCLFWNKEYSTSSIIYISWSMNGFEAESHGVARDIAILIVSKNMWQGIASPYTLHSTGHFLRSSAKHPPSVKSIGKQTDRQRFPPW